MFTKMLNRGSHKIIIIEQFAILKGIAHQQTILRLVHKRITPTGQQWFIFNFFIKYGLKSTNYRQAEVIDSYIIHTFQRFRFV